MSAAASVLPRVGFVIGGMQKSGTSALARYLGAHPRVRLPVGKEAHVFDAADFDDAMDVAGVDARYASHFPDGVDAQCLHGDATPIYTHHPRFIERIRRYNPAMRWVLLLRHPVERAVSNYQMERRWGRERLPLWLALLREDARLRGREDDFSHEAPLRRCSYRRRGDYAAQLDALYAHFPREQVLLLRSTELAEDPAACLLRVCAFLGLPPPPELPAFDPVFVGDYTALRPGGLRWRLLSWWLRRELAAQRTRHGLEWRP